MPFSSKYDILCIVCLFFVVADFAIAQDIIGCGGFVKSEVEINFSLIEVKLYTKQGSLKYQTDCAPNNGYYMIPVYDKGDYVLKVEPPPGWTFEPESIELRIDGQTDPCSKSEDVNFKFTGFGVVGKVVSMGQSSGPAGVTLTLRKLTSKEVVKQTTSVSGGSFTFEKVLPGEYSVEGSHKSWLFEKSTSPVVVGRETGNVGSSVKILGYDVQGQVFGDGEPVRDVMFLLFSDTVAYNEVHGCEPFPDAGLPREIPSEPLCYTTSGEDGTFVFGALPCGKYRLIPFYQGDLITFDVVPSTLDFTVDHDSVVLKEPFQVAGFSVGGRTLTAQGGLGVPNAKVLLNGKPATTTNADGHYTLDGMKTGTYAIDIIAPDMAFDTAHIKITPNTPQLTDIFVARFSVCGNVIIDKLPEGLTHLSKQRKVTVAVKGQGNADLSTVLTEEDGKFCTMLKPGNYVLKVVLSDMEVRAGLKLAPTEREVKVKDTPIKEVKFTQFRAQVSGKIKCLESCGPLQLTLAAVGRHDDRQTIQSQTFTDGSRFTFHNVMPGKYKVTLLKDEWCWKKSSLELEVVDRDVNSLEFIQSGYILSCSLSHDIILNFAQEKKSGNVGSFDLTKGVNKFCLSQPGVYKLTPVSCHRFERQVYDYDTSSPRILSLSAVSHKIEGVIVSQVLQDDIMITIRSSADSDKPVSVGPLKAPDSDAPLPPAKSAEKNDKKATEKGEKPKEKVPAEPKGPFTYRFSHWARAGEKLTLSPSSRILLFYPPLATVTVSGDVCQGEVAKFEGKEGVFIIGQIQPPLSDVQIKITPKADNEDIIEMKTDEKGSYKVGPLHGDKQYDITAQMDGYVLTPGDSKGHFKAFKLGEINVQVRDDADKPLGGVLLSLTGGNAYRSNNLSLPDGTMKFSSLSPGQYYLRPMMKEYNFEPASQMIEVTEGSTLVIKIKGHRVAFSCYGSVTSLNGEPEQEIFVEALGFGSEDCDTHHEESKTDPDGTFRIRGLKPKCEYTVRLRSGDMNQHIERSAPKSRSVKVLDEDVTDIHIIAFRRFSQLDLSGNVITATEHLSSLKIHLYKETDMDAPLYTTSLTTTSFFYLPSIKIDNEEYILRLESSLSKSSYEHSASEVVFTANTTYKHVTFRFSPQRKSIDQELSQSSILALPLTLLVIFLAYNHKKLVPLLNQNVSMLRKYAIRPSVAHESATVSASVPSPIEIQMVQKRQKPRKV